MSDGAGGLRFINPQWLPNSLADTDSAATYIFAEARLRLLLYELIGDPHQLAIARGLAVHQQRFHWKTNSEGWVELKFWPCIVSWSDRASAPPGSIWDVFQFDPTDPEPAEDASFLADFLNSATQYGLLSQVGINLSFIRVQQTTFMNYMVVDSLSRLPDRGDLCDQAFRSQIRPKTAPLFYSADPWAPSAWAPSILSNETFTNANWNWMLQIGLAPQNYPIGYFLRAWARSEAAQTALCSAQMPRVIKSRLALP